MNEEVLGLIGLSEPPSFENKRNSTAEYVWINDQIMANAKDLHKKKVTGPYTIYRHCLLAWDSEVAVKWLIDSRTDDQVNELLTADDWDFSTPVADRLTVPSLMRTYIGQTKQGWGKRLSQHKADAARGSNLLFHKLLRTQAKLLSFNERKAVIGKELALAELNCGDLVVDYSLAGPIFTQLLRVGISKEEADEEEERLVAQASLWPLGLNMIPGGKAGLAFLAKNGIRRKATDKGRDWRAVERLLNKKGGPLKTFQGNYSLDSLKRIICNNPNNFSEEEVKRIRTMAAIGWDYQDIARSMGIDVCSWDRVANVIKGKTYKVVL